VKDSGASINVFLGIFVQGHSWAVVLGCDATSMLVISFDRARKPMVYWFLFQVLVSLGVSFWNYCC
jgi:hypothetical protein